MQKVKYPLCIDEIIFEIKSIHYHWLFFSHERDIQDEYSDIIREKLSMFYSSRIRFVAG